MRDSLTSNIATQLCCCPVLSICKENRTAPDLDSESLHAFGKNGAEKHRAGLWYSVSDRNWQRRAAVRRGVATGAQKKPNRREKAFSQEFQHEKEARDALARLINSW